ncbi:MAG: hypothetical protein NTZ24_16795 [Deltaproteobacteria bacterium]|nr:hypothetical protein [Deltaproteobacteria bacterium]
MKRTVETVPAAAMQTLEDGNGSQNGETGEPKPSNNLACKLSAVSVVR